ncbi:hypothetical protein BJ912DRAFT_1052977 [Pholiota molesta]|nr:hypothetical protein BJ912DRAFT_1052977 [Pholiota molesta]
MLFSSRYLAVISLFLLTSSVAAAPIAKAASEIAERGSSDWRRDAPTEDWRRSEDVEARGSVGPGTTDWKRSENEARGGIGATDWNGQRTRLAAA